jgi:transposase-like protein
MAEKKRPPPVNATPPEIRDKAVAELRRRQKTGEPIAGLSKLFGISEPTIYAWARLGTARSPLKHGQRIDAATKAAALAEMSDRTRGAELEALAVKYKTTAKTLRQWRLRAMQRGGERAAGSPVVEGPIERFAPEKKTRKSWPVELKQRVVDAYVTRGPGEEAKHVAARFGIPESYIHAWNRETRNGVLPPLSRGARPNGMQLAMPDVMQPLDGHQLDVSISAGPANGLGLLQLRNMQLEAENKRFRKIISLLMEPA